MDIVNCTYFDFCNCGNVCSGKEWRRINFPFLSLKCSFRELCSSDQPLLDQRINHLHLYSDDPKQPYLKDYNLFP